MTLALAVAVLALAGCGGGSSEDASSAQAASTAEAQGAPKSASADPTSSGAGAGGSEAQGKAGEGDVSGGGGGGSTGSEAGSPSTSGKKHGPRIAVPKGPAEQAPAPSEVAHATVADMSLQSPAIIAAQGSPGRLAATYTCDGGNSWPALNWGGIPDGSAELILYAMNVQPVEGQLFVDWAVAGISPRLEEIDAGKLPSGAVVGENGFGKVGYSLCPTGSGEIYMFALYALPQSLSLKRGFDAREVRKRILDVSGNVGLLPAVYERG
jgi:phosphatidylethanolamine-binding protein (PEBP) family uncharacterized protein